MSAYEHPELRALDEVEDLLEAYAGARLAPSSPVLSRIRTAVMLEASARAASQEVERRRLERRALAAAPRRSFAFPSITWRSLARPAFALGFAGLLAVGTGTAVTSAGPGSPFYGARVAIEQAFLPTQIDARLASLEQHLAERLAAAEAAAAAGDVTGLAAALAAYQDEIDQTLADVDDDYARLEHVQAVLEAHAAKLVALSQRLPTEVARDNAGANAIAVSERAVTKVRDAVEKVEAKKAHASNRPSSPPGPGNPGSGGTGGGGPNDKGGENPDP